MRGNSHAPFGNRPTEQEPTLGHLAGRPSSLDGRGLETEPTQATAPAPTLLKRSTCSGFEPKRPAGNRVMPKLIRPEEIVVRVG